MGLKLNGTHWLLAYADDVNLLGDNIDTVKKKTETLIDASKEVGPEINIEKTKYILLSCKNTAVGIRHAGHLAPSIRKSWESLRRQAAVARSV
jgi:hypothetical protein